MNGGTQPQSGSALKLLEDYPKPAGATPALYEKLKTLCGPRWIDLLTHLPTRLLDRSATPAIAAAPVGERATFIATVIKRGALPPRHVKRPMSIELSDGTAPLRAVFFNAGSWLERAFPVGETVIVSGMVESDSKGKKIIHPDVWSVGKSANGGEEKHKAVAKIWPLYPLTAGVGQGWLTRAIAGALKVAEDHPLPEWLPSTFRETHQLPTMLQALQQVHNPQNEGDLAPQSPARVRLALDEFYATQLALQHARATARALQGIAHGSAASKTLKLLAALPFPLTADQQNALTEIHDDLSAPRPMLRLLQGDVGSGKTLVALLALLRVIENGRQGALMAPTEILARQLYANAKKYLEPLGITTALLVGSQTAAQKKRVRQHVQEGFVNLLIGTHALTEDSVQFANLGLAVIDEQHRFGVQQRIALTANAASSSPHTLTAALTPALTPDILLMTATPIPRTLALTAYGDMDTSLLRQKPPGRTPIQTVVMPEDRLPEIATRLNTVMAEGQQAYWVCPLVEESEETDLTAATARFGQLQKTYGEKVGLLHGKMKPAEKTAVMEAFLNRQTGLLVSTTVIEVGVDVPNATVMVIEHAERFGLAQLHQLRGRVGRGTLASRCLLLYSPPLSLYAQQRLQALRDSEDGFYLAEKDLELRGPGEVLGSRQSGELKTMLADLHHHRDLLPLAKELAEKAISRPLNAAQRNALAALLSVFGKQTAAEWLRGG